MIPEESTEPRAICMYAMSVARKFSSSPDEQSARGLKFRIPLAGRRLIGIARLAAASCVFAASTLATAQTGWDIRMAPRFPTEHDTILVTKTVNCNVEADRVAIDGDVIDIVLDAFCSGFSPEASTAIVEIGKLPPGSYTARLSQRFHEDSGSPYSVPYELATLRFKVLPAASGDDLRDFFRIPAPGDTGVTVLAADVNVFERLTWSERPSHLGGGLTLWLESKSQGSRPILDMLHMPMASDPSAAASILYFGHTDRFGNTICCPYAPLVPAAQAYPARWLISSILPSAPYGSMSVTRTGPVRRNSYGIEYDAVLLSFRSLPAG